MSPRAKATTWREALPRTIDERHRHWARRRGYTLTVVVARRSGVGLQAEALVQGARSAGMVWPMPYLSRRSLAATVAVAKAWAEKQADELAAQSGGAVPTPQNRTKGPVRFCAPLGQRGTK